MNLVSNDVRRFDDIGPYYMHIWAGPLEVICVLVMVGAQLTFPAAIAGIATLLLLIPFQAGLLPFAAALLPTGACLLYCKVPFLCWPFHQPSCCTLSTTPCPSHMHLTLLKFPVTVEVCYHRNCYSYDQLSAASIWLRTPVYNMKVGYILKEYMQGVLSKHIARLRTNTARHTDERVRLAGEAIAGSLAVKMLG